MVRSLVFQGVGGVPIRAVVEGTGPLVTLVHGVGANLESWDAIAARLAGQFTVARADLRGHGGSGHITTCTMDDFVGDVALMLAALGAPRTHLVGFSLGGLIGQHVATKRPELIDRLVLISSVANRTAEERARVVERAALVRQQGIAAVVGAAAERWFTPEFKARHPEVIAARLKELVANDLESYAAAYLAFGLGDQGMDPALIRCPTLIMTGEHDPGSHVGMQEYLHAGIAGSTLKILPGLRHSVLLEAPEMIAALVAEFLTHPPAIRP